MSVPPPYNANSGGGLLGAIKRRLMADSVIGPLLGDRIQPGRMNPGTPFPFILMNHVNDRLTAYPWFTIPSGDIEHIQDVDQEYDVFDTSIQVTVFQEGYDNCRLLGLYMHRVLSRQVYAIDTYCVVMYGDTHTMAIEPKKSENGNDVWQSAYRYTAQQAIQVFPPPEDEWP